VTTCSAGPEQNEQRACCRRRDSRSVGRAAAAVVCPVAGDRSKFSPDGDLVGASSERPIFDASKHGWHNGGGKGKGESSHVARSDETSQFGANQRREQRPM
jgi:hypothetical protein